jgi:hypothetical protein
VKASKGHVPTPTARNWVTNQREISSVWPPQRVSAMKRKLAWVCLMVLPLVLGGAAFCLCDRDPITQANCDKIKPGMTIEEVETILGGEKDDVFAGDCWWGKPTFIWNGSRGSIWVEVADPLANPPIFVNNAQFLKWTVYRLPPQTFFDKIWNWLGL